jgi:hypothetical protein
MSEVDKTQVDEFYSVTPAPDEGTTEETPASPETTEEAQPEDDGYVTVAGGELEDEQKTEVEAESEEETPPAEQAPAQAEPTKDQAIRERLKFIQTRHQETVKRLKERFGEEFYGQLMSGSDPKPLPEPNEEADERAWIAYEARKAVREEMIQQRQEERAQQYDKMLATETAAARGTLEQLQAIAMEAGVSQDDINRAFESVNGYNFNLHQLGQPKGYALAFADRIDILIDRLQAANPASTIKATVEAKLDAAKKIKQPSTAPAGLAPKRKLTEEERHLKEMFDVGQNPEIDNFFKVG